MQQLHTTSSLTSMYKPGLHVTSSSGTSSGVTRKDEPIVAGAFDPQRRERVPTGRSRVAAERGGCGDIVDADALPRCCQHMPAPAHAVKRIEIQKIANRSMSHGHRRDTSSTDPELDRDPAVHTWRRCPRPSHRSAGR